MKITYRGDCEEMYGREIEVIDHVCEDHAVYICSEQTETHGLDCGPYERWTESWWECAICKQQIDDPAENMQ